MPSASTHAARVAAGGLGAYKAAVLDAVERLRPKDAGVVRRAGLDALRTRPVSSEMVDRVMLDAPSAPYVYSPTGMARVLSGAVHPDQDLLYGMDPELYGIQGLNSMITPREWLDMSMSLPDSADHRKQIYNIAKSIEQRGLASPPMHYIDGQPSGVTIQHDGRHRMLGIGEMIGRDTPFPTLFMRDLETVAPGAWSDVKGIDARVETHSPAAMRSEFGAPRIPDAVRVGTWHRGGLVRTQA